MATAGRHYKGRDGQAPEFDDSSPTGRQGGFRGANVAGLVDFRPLWFDRNDRDTMLTLAASLDGSNNLGCPLN